jgi:hypothetical protein
MQFTVKWQSHADTEAGQIEVEATNEQEARTKALDHLKTHYEDELKDLGIKITTVTPHDKAAKSKDGQA